MFHPPATETTQKFKDLERAEMQLQISDQQASQPSESEQGSSYIVTDSENPHQMFREKNSEVMFSQDFGVQSASQDSSMGVFATF